MTDDLKLAGTRYVGGDSAVPMIHCVDHLLILIVDYDPDLLRSICATSTSNDRRNAEGWP